MDVPEHGRQLAQKRSGHRAVADEGARFSVHRNFTLHNQLFIPFVLDSRAAEHASQLFRQRQGEDAGNASFCLPAPYHLRRSSRSQQQSQRVHHNGFAAARFAGQYIQPFLETDAGLLHDGIVLNNELHQHVTELYGRRRKRLLHNLFSRP